MADSNLIPIRILNTPMARQEPLARTHLHLTGSLLQTLLWAVLHVSLTAMENCNQ